jgi:hypothetical protein
MPKIVFDPDGESEGTYNFGSKVKGGGIDRYRYVELCKQMARRDSSIDYPEIKDEILDYMYKDVTSYIDTLPEKDKNSILDDIDAFFNNADSNSPNQIDNITIINIIGIQISLLFTLYYDPNLKYVYSSSYIIDDFELKTNEWKDSNTLKNMLESNDEFNYLLNEKGGKIFMVFIGFLSLGELIESYLNNIFYVGLSYKIDYIDGALNSPISFLGHDIFHYQMFEDCYNYPIILQTFKEFHKYIMNSAISNSKINVRYAINFVLFFIFHEEPYCVEDTIKFIDNNVSTQLIYDHLITNIENLISVNNQGLAIPKAYRKFVKNSKTELEEEPIQEYLQLVSEVYVQYYKQFLETQTGGGKKYKKRRQTHKKRSVHKKTKTHRRKLHRK